MGAWAAGKTFQVELDDAGRVILTAVVQVPEHEAWLWKNHEAVAAVRRGLADAAEGNTRSLGTFSDLAAVKVPEP